MMPRLVFQRATFYIQYHMVMILSFFLETHGNNHDLSRLRHLFKDFRIYNSWGDDCKTGGIIILVRKSSLVGALEPDFNFFSPPAASFALASIFLYRNLVIIVGEKL